MRKLVLSCLAGILAFAGLAGVAGAQSLLTMTVAPTSGPAGTALVLTSTDPCSTTQPVVSKTVEVRDTADNSVVATGTPDGNGNWVVNYTVPAGTSPGSLSFDAVCSGMLASGGKVTYGVYAAVTFTVETTTTSSSTTSTTAAPSSPSVKVSTSTVSPGGAIDIASSGWQPGATITITLNSTPVQVGSAMADAVGDVATQVFVPIDFPPGQHTLTLAGLNFAGVQASVSSAITIGATVVGQAATNTTVAATTAAATTTSGSLPVTGRSSLPLAFGASMLIIGGGALVLAARRRNAAAALVRAEVSDRPR